MGVPVLHLRVKHLLATQSAPSQELDDDLQHCAKHDRGGWNLLLLESLFWSLDTIDINKATFKTDSHLHLQKEITGLAKCYSIP